MQIGTILKNRYRILQKLGSGGFGETYLAEDGDLPGNPRCVVKHLQPKTNDPDAISVAQRLFEREAESLYKLGQKSDRIPSLFLYFKIRRQFYLIQEYIEGRDLSQEIVPGKPLSESYVWALLVGILEVLEVAHRQKVIHRDIKPQNLMRRQEDGKIILIDFGAVKEIGTLIVNPQGQTSMTVAVGTPGYMPSEQSNGKPKLSSDIYAVGMVGIQALTGLLPHQLPEDPRTGDVIWRDRVSVSKKLGDILDKMVRDHFSQRYLDAAEALAALTSGSAPPKATTTQTFTTVKIDSRGQIIKRLRGQVKVLTENLGNGVILEMVSIPGGSFMMGSPKNEERRYESESPQHRVKVLPFFMGKYPITQAQYQAVMRNNPSYFKGANRPVERVNWKDATEFCRQLSQRTGKTYRLPSEAEWEYACRAGTTTPFYFGPTITTDLANYDGNGTYGSAPKGVYREHTTNVGSFPPNAFGLYDMHGNVDEWCQDVWHNNYNAAPTDGTAWESGGESSYRIVRGDCWASLPWNCRCANRSWKSRGTNVNGFRVLLLPDV